MNPFVNYCTVVPGSLYVWPEAITLLGQVLFYSDAKHLFITDGTHLGSGLRIILHGKGCK